MVSCPTAKLENLVSKNNNKSAHGLGNPLFRSLKAARANMWVRLIVYIIFYNGFVQIFKEDECSLSKTGFNTVVMAPHKENNGPTVCLIYQGYNKLNGKNVQKKCSNYKNVA